jgi:hypothetical protein
MSPHIDPHAIEKRQSEIRDNIANLEKEAAELDIALRVFKRFSVPEAAAENNGADVAKLGPRRPPGIPSNFQMAELILKDAEREGKTGLTAKEIVEKISARYWPGVADAQIMPAIYGFGRDGRIRKTASGKFKVVHRNDEGPDVVAPEPS